MTTATQAMGGAYMPVRNKEQLLHTFIEAAEQEIREHQEPNSCVLMTRVSVDVLSRYGFAVTPLVVKVVVLNKPYLARMTRMLRGEIRTDQEDLRQWEREDGSWRITMGYRDGPLSNRFTSLASLLWGKHLVAIVTDRDNSQTTMLLDLTLGQIRDEKHGIMLGPHLARCPLDFVQGVGQLNTILNGCFVQYYAYPHDTSYQVSDYWKDDSQGPVIRLTQTLEKYAGKIQENQSMSHGPVIGGTR